MSTFAVCFNRFYDMPYIRIKAYPKDQATKEKGMSFIKYIADENHYKEVLSLVSKAKQTVWIGKFCKECGRREYCSDPIK